MYENSRFPKNRFTFCGVNTNFGQQWAPPAYYHFTPIVSKGKHCIYNMIWPIHPTKTTKCNYLLVFDTLRPSQNNRHFPEDVFKCISFIENIWISIKISLKFVPKGPINNIPALVQIRARCRPGDEPLFAAMMVRLPTHICTTRPSWVNIR